MNTEKINTLTKVHDAIDIVEDARGIEGLSTSEKKILEKASVNLRNLERTIIKVETIDLVNRVTADTIPLQELIVEIKKSGDKLSKIADAISKATKVVEALIQITNIAARAGLMS